MESESNVKSFEAQVTVCDIELESGLTVAWNLPYHSEDSGKIKISLSIWALSSMGWGCP